MECFSGYIAILYRVLLYMVRRSKKKVEGEYKMNFVKTESNIISCDIGKLQCLYYLVVLLLHKR